MASHYQRGNVFWIKYRDASGKLRREGTAYRVGSIASRRHVEELVARKTLDEKQTRGSMAHEAWDKWIAPFLAERYRNNSRTLQNMVGTWGTLRGFMREQGIDFPRQLTRAHCLQYLQWRVVPGKWRGKYAACRNTAITEIVRLGAIMREAVHRGYASSNPCRELGLKRDPWREKPALDAGHITMIRRNIAALPEGERKEFFHNSFEIARYHGCRFSETWLNPQRDIVNGNIVFRAKGGRIHSVPLHPALKPLFDKLIADGRTETYVMPKAATKHWHNFFHAIGLKKLEPNACFHSLRVCVATELALQNVSLTKAMRYLGHKSPMVHKIYQRLQAEDMQEVQKVIR